jgi:nucleoside-diphosphate-sugar epimerase
MKVLLTGAAGRIGLSLTRDFRDRYRLRLTDCRETPASPDIIRADLTDRAATAGLVAGMDVVVHLAADPRTRATFDELLNPNIIAVHNILDESVKAGVKRVVFASTCNTVTAYPYDVTVRVHDPVRPPNLYGATKAFGEIMGRVFHEQHGLEFIALRLGAFQHYDSSKTEAPWFRNMWLSPRDCASLFRLAIEKPGIGYAIVFGTSVTDREYLSRREAREILGYEPQDSTRILFPLPPVAQTA